MRLARLAFYPFPPILIGCWVPQGSLSKSAISKYQTISLIPKISSGPATPSYQILSILGLYRVNYDSHNWELLTKTMLEKSETIPVVNRVQLIDDALELAASGNLDYSIALKLLTYLVSETEYLPWKAALVIFDRMDKRLHRKLAYGLWKVIKKFYYPFYPPLKTSPKFIYWISTSEPYLILF